MTIRRIIPRATTRQRGEEAEGGGGEEGSFPPFLLRKVESKGKRWQVCFAWRENITCVCMQGCGFKDNGRETGGAGLAEGARTTGHDLARPRRGLPGEGEERVALVSSQVTATRGRPLDIVASFSRTPPSSSSHHHHLGFYRRAPPSPSAAPCFSVFARKACSQKGGG